jgi:hypothetical protein
MVFIQTAHLLLQELLPSNITSDATDKDKGAHNIATDYNYRSHQTLQAKREVNSENVVVHGFPLNRKPIHRPLRGRKTGSARNSVGFQQQDFAFALTISFSTA